MHIIDTQSRSKLSEGRTSGMGFGFLRKKDESNFETIMPVSPCKDYLNEVVYTENTGVPTSAYGFKYDKKLDIFTDNIFMAIKMMPDKQGNYNYANSLSGDQKKLKDQAKNIEKIMNDLEQKLGISDRTCIFEANDHFFLVKAPLDWKMSTHTISMYTLILRAALTHKGEMTIQGILDSYDGIQMEKSMINATSKLIKEIIEKNELPDQKMKHDSSTHFSPHNYGIMHLINY